MESEMELWLYSRLYRLRFREIRGPLGGSCWEGARTRSISFRL